MQHILYSRNNLMRHTEQPLMIRVVCKNVALTELKNFVARAGAALAALVLCPVVLAQSSACPFNASSIAAPGVPRTFSVLDGATFKVGGEYLVSPLTTVNFEGVIGTDQQPDGQWFNHYSTSVALSNKINDVSNFGISTSLGYSEALLAPDGRRAIINFSLAPSYSLQLARDWNMLATYRFAVIDSTSGAAISNEVGVSISHHFVALR